MEGNTNFKINTDNEIDIIKIISQLINGKRIIIYSTIFFIVIGTFVAFFTPNEYTASTIMVPQSGERKTSNGLSGLAAMAGININTMSSGEILSPSIYPQILDNINFKKELIYKKYSFDNFNEQVSYYEYLTNKRYKSFNILEFIKKYTIGLPRTIINVIKKESINKRPDVKLSQNNIIDKLSISENIVINSIFSNLNLSLNEKLGYISISYKCTEPKLAAEVVYTTQNLLQKYITDFKLQKVRSNLEFVEKNYEEAKVNFEQKQNELAEFRDSNMGLTSAIYRTHEDKLIAEYNLLLSIFSELSKQKEQAKIAVNETTPILTIISPVVEPAEKSGPNRLLILLGYIFIGLIVGIIWVLAKPHIEDNFAKLRKL